MNRGPIRRLLLIEDNLGDARLLREMLKDSGSNLIKLHHVETMTEAEVYLAHESADVILLDLGLADAQGLEAVRRAPTAARAPWW